MHDMANKRRSSKYNILSRLFFCWIDPLFCSGCRRTLTENDLYQCPGEIQSTSILSKYNRLWKFECNNRPDNPRLWLVIIKCIWWRLILQLVVAISLVIVIVIISELVGLLSEFYTLADPSLEETRNAYLFGIGLSLLTLAVTMLNLLFYLGEKLGGIIRIIWTSAIYHKVLLLSQASLNKISIGHVVNLASNDVHRYDQAVIYLPYFIATPVHCVIVFYFLYNEIGVSALLPFGFIISVSILQIILSVLFIKIRSKAAVITDQRIKVMNEVISGIRVIKMYAWEYVFSNIVKKIRKSEIWMIFLSFVIKGLPQAMNTFQISLSLFLVFSVYSSLGGQLSPRIVFSTLLHLSYLRYTVSHFLLGLLQVSEGFVGYKRIKAFLLATELQQYPCTPLKDVVIDEETVSGSFIWFENVTLSWSNDSEATVLENLSFNMDMTKPLLAVIGKIGSGKSTFLQSLLKELPPVEGNIVVNGSVAYASQEPWVFSGSFQENVLFGASYNADWYQQVIQACALDTDISILKFGDKTLIGERGVTLSGGQKARVSLARAVYRNSDIYLLDDPLSAVDAGVGRHLFERCIKGLLSNKCVVLVTHQKGYLDQCDSVLVLNEKHGTFYDCSSECTDVLNYIKAKTPEKNDDTDTIQCNNMPEDTQFSTDKSQVNINVSIEDFTDENVVKDEERTHGGISYWTYINYFKAGGGILSVTVILLVTILTEANMVASDWWIADWSDCSVYTNTTVSRCSLSNGHRIAISGGIVSSLILFSFTRVVVFFGVLFMASYIIHKRMFENVLRAPVLFFDTNPIGRILNRFSKDIGFMDDLLPYHFLELQRLLSRCVAIFILTLIANPYLIIPLALISVVTLFLRWYFIKTARAIRRLEAIARSPVYSHISHTLRGLSTIRSYSMEEDALNKFHQYHNNHSMAWYMTIVVKRWFGIRLDLLMNLFITITVLSSIEITRSTNLDPALIGLSVAYIFSLTDDFSFSVRTSTDIENYMISVERLLAYGRLESEANLESNPSVMPPSEWPYEGCIEMKDVSFSYSPSGPNVLKNISCLIQPKEKVGIIGRTGAGKSSIVSALLRIAEPKGVIKIDGIELSSLGLHDVRGNISVIPQDPVLFVGSVQYNLDPNGLRNEEEIWKALENVQLNEVIRSLEGELDFTVTESGSNFSVGQRQLLCLARALLQKNKILIMDEATANIDLETDMLIQEVIRQQFTDCTVLTIAHRLNTVMDSDKIMVLQDGEIVEYGIPFELLQNSQSVLSWFVNQTGLTSAEKLKETVLNDNY